MYALIKLALLSISLIASPVASTVSDDLQNAIRVEIEQLRISGQLSLGDVHIASGDLLAEFYERRNFQPAWTTIAQTDSLLAAIEDSYLEGFNPADYNLEKIRLAQQLLSNELLPHQRAVIDLAFTDSFIRLGYHHRFGKVNPYNLDAHWNFVRELSKQDSVALIQQAIDDANIPKTLADLFPKASVYARLEEALARYRQLAAGGGWPVIPEGPLIKPGGTDERLPLIGQRVHISGDLASPADITSILYDETLEAAIRRFQFRHGLAEDGVMGPATFAALNVPVEHRIEQIRASLERARWVVHSIPDDYIIVNIAGFSARLVRDRNIVWETKAVVGIEYHKTPVFRGDIKYVVLNPTWTVPYSIATREMLPRIKQDPTSYFRDRDFDIKDREGRLVNAADVDWQQLSRGNFGYTFVQRPGPKNALGQVKFIFPNKHAVYLHDTPGKAAFDKAKRAFSHGCIRLDQPLDLAELLLADKGWDRERIDANKETKTIFLKQPLAVLIMYWTAEVLPDGTVRFFNDVYERDKAVLDALAAPFRMEPPEV